MDCGCGRHAVLVLRKHKAARGWQRLKDKLDAAEVDLDGVRLEVLADPLGEMYGRKVL